MKPKPSHILYWYFSEKSLPYWCILLIDVGIVFATGLLVYTLNNGAVHTIRHFWPLCLTQAIYTLFYMIGFRLFHTYAGVIRYSSFTDLQRVGGAMLVGLALSTVFHYVTAGASWLQPIRMRDVIQAAVCSVLLMWAVRIIVKHLYDSIYQTDKAERIFIFGVKDGGISIAKSVRNQSPSNYVLAGFTADEEAAEGKMLMGVKVYAFNPTLLRAMRKCRATKLFVSPARADDLRANEKMVDLLISHGIKIFMVPSEQEWDGKSDITHQQLREVNIEDLLPRQQIQVDMEGIGRCLQGKRILITGAAGSIGSELVRQVATFHPDELVLVDQAETPLHDIRLMMQREHSDIKATTCVSDIVKEAKMERVFRKHRPQYVFHAAAYKHVPMMEDNPGESVHNNVEGTRVIADLSVKYGVSKFVMISTDKAVNPTNVMGCSKRICEIYAQSLDKAIKDGKVEGKTQFVTTRFGNVLGSNGSVIPLFKEQIRNGGPITVTHPNIIRYFMLIPEACKLVLEAATQGHGGEIFVFDMGKPVKIVSLAERMIKLSGANVEIKFTGLREGEKLYEEVLNEAETTLPTFHEKIKIAKVREYEYDSVREAIAHLVAGCYSKDAMSVVAEMKALVPEFKSRNSVYESLDG